MASAGTSCTPTRISRGRWPRRSRSAPRRRAWPTCSRRCWCRPRRSWRCGAAARCRPSASSFPGYVLVKMEMTDAAYHLIKNTPKVTGFLGADNKAMPITEDEAMRILHQVKEGVERPKPMVTFEIGEKVRVADGPFASFEGHVEEVDEQRARAQGRRVDLRPADAGRAGVRSGREGRLRRRRRERRHRAGREGRREGSSSDGEEDRRLHQLAGAGGAGQPVAADRPGARPARPQHHGVLQAVQRQDQGHGAGRADPGEDHRLLGPLVHLRDAHAAGVASPQEGGRRSTAAPRSRAAPAPARSRWRRCARSPSRR